MNNKFCIICLNERNEQVEAKKKVKLPVYTNGDCFPECVEECMIRHGKREKKIFKLCKDCYKEFKNDLDFIYENERTIT